MTRLRSIRIPFQVPFAGIALVSLLTLFAVLSGAATAIAGTFAVFVFGGIALGAVALLVPLHWLIVSLFLASFLIIGQITYFAGIYKVTWITFLLGLLLLVRLPIDMMQRKRLPASRLDESRKSLLAMKFFIGLFFATLLTSTLIHLSPPIQILITSKEYVFLWGLYMIIAAGLIRPRLVERIWAWLPWLMLLQLPLIIYQRFYVMSVTHAAAKWDVIVGAFGGSQEGGGASGAMGFFCLVGIVTVINRFRADLMPRWQMLLLVVAGILGIALAEIKYMILLLPICFGLVFARELMRSPLKGTLLIGLGFILAFGVLFAYKKQFGEYYRAMTVEEYFEGMIVGQTDTSYVSKVNRTQGRMAAIVFWYRQQKASDPVSLLVGQGAGSSRATMTFIGEAQAAHFERLARSTLAILLWETGLLGTFAYVAMLGSASLTLWRQSLDPTRESNSRTTLQSMAVAIVILAASLPYDENLLFSSQLQLLLLTSMGYSVMRKTPTSASEEGSAKTMRRRLPA